MKLGTFGRWKFYFFFWHSCVLANWTYYLNLMQVLATSARGVAETSNGLGNDSLNGLDNDSRLNFGEDDENMVSSSKSMSIQGYSLEASMVNHNRDKHLRYRTRVFAAEYVSLLHLLIFLLYIFANPNIYLFSISLFFNLFHSVSHLTKIIWIKMAEVITCRCSCHYVYHFYDYES